MKHPAVWLLAVVALTVKAQVICAQAKRADGCPTVTVSCPDSAEAATLTFTASVSGADPTVKLTFNWTVSAGTITGGQGTSSIIVDTAGFEGQSFTATVEVGGPPRLCSNTASCSTNICHLPLTRKFDEYGDIPFADEKARLDNFAIELQNDPTAQGYLICYGGRRAYEGEAQRRGKTAKDYLVKERGIEKARLVVIDGGYREERAVELFVVPSGASPPAASPTVDPKEVEILVEREHNKDASQ